MSVLFRKEDAFVKHGIPVVVISVHSVKVTRWSVSVASASAWPKEYG